jgi:hypothetical protein
MSLISKRLVSIVASTALLSLVSAAAHAQTTDVLTLDRLYEYQHDGFVKTEYTFNSSMILNSIGFVATNNTSGWFEYRLNGDVVKFFNFNDQSLAPVANGIRWYTLPTPLTLTATDVVRLDTEQTSDVVRLDEDQNNIGQATAVQVYSSKNPNVYVNTDYNRQGESTEQLTNSNLRVSPSNPGSNVAPEPGSFALTLTGGAALIGICIRRRRNAG